MKIIRNREKKEMVAYETHQLNQRLCFRKSTNTGMFPYIGVIYRKGQYATEKYSLKR